MRKLPTLKFFYAGYDKNDEAAQPYTDGRSQTEIFNFATKLWDEFEADPSKYAYVPPCPGCAASEDGVCPLTGLSLENPSKSGCAIAAKGEDTCSSSGCEIQHPPADGGCGSSGCAIAQAEPVATVKAAAPESKSANAPTASHANDALGGICTDGQLCVVAFLADNSYKQQQITELTRVANEWVGVPDEKVEVFWIQSGSNWECENALDIANMQEAVIAFTAESPMYRTMHAEVTADNIKSFINEIKQTGLDGHGLQQPYGGIELYEAK